MTQYQGSPNQRWGHISYAQHGDDLMLVNLFEMLGIEKPSYLDLGAHQPTDISNTKLLYERGSRGVNVEANPSLIDLFKKERPLDINLCMAVGLEKAATFLMYGEKDGRNTFSAAEAASTEMSVTKRITLPMFTLREIVDQWCGGTFPHLLNCDIEGLDYDVLKNADFSKSSPLVICVETRRHDTKRMELMLREQGFTLYCRMGENLFFVRDSFIRLCY